MIQRAIKYRKVTLFFVLVVAAIGVYNYYMLPKQENPDISAPYAMVMAVYPGASPQDVKELVTDKLESRIREIQGVYSTNTQSRNSVSIIIVKLTNGAEVDEVWGELYRSMGQVQGDLPEQCLPIEVNTDLYKTAGMIIALSSEDYSYEELEGYAGSYISELGRIDGIASFDIEGKQEKQINVELNIQDLNTYNLSMEEVSQLIASQNVKIPAGQINSEHGKVAVDTTGTYTSLEDIENLVVLISEDTGSALRLKDIGRVYYDYSDENRSIRHNGVNAILLTAYFKQSQNILLIGDEVKDTISKVSDDLPEDLNIDYVLYQPDDVDASLQEFMMNLFQGIAIVILIVFLGLGFRNAIIVSVAIPLSMLSTFAMMPILGVKVHQISIVSLIVVLGMLVDNAIVVSDSIQVLMDRGENPFDACVKGVKMVAIPVLTSTLTTIAVFIALLFLGGVAGEFIMTLPKLLVVALVASYLIALFVTPTLAYVFFKPNQKQSTGFNFVRKVFENLLHRGMNHPKRTVGIAIVWVILSLLLLMGINFSLFPIADNNIININVYSHGVDDMEQTRGLIESIEDVLKDEQQVISYTSAIGGALPKYYYSTPVYANSPDFGQLLVRFNIEDTEFKTQHSYAEHIQGLLDEVIIGGDVEAKLLKQAEPVPAIRYVITGKDTEILRDTSIALEELVRHTEGTTNVRSDYSPDEYQFYVDVNPAVAMYYGISKYDVQREISLAIAGREISTFVHKGQEYPIVIKGNMKSVDALHNFSIKSKMIGKKTPLKQVADIEPKKQVTIIRSHNGDLAITVMADVLEGYNATALSTEIESKIKAKHFNNVVITGDGEKASIINLFGDVGTIAIMGVLMVFAVLVVQFKSYKDPLLILVTLPLACVGSIIGLFITRQELSFTALIGMVSLIGIVVNNAIVLLDYIQEEEKKDKGLRQACEDAVKQRFRPIMLSSFTTIMGLIPLALSGEVLFVPMSVALIFGLLIATLLTLVFFPVIYYLAYRNKKYDSKKEVSL